VQNLASIANAFVDGNGLDLLSSNLGRLDECVAEDAKGVEDALTLVEYLLDLDHAGALGRSSSASGVGAGDAEGKSVVVCICEQTALLSWLFERIGREDNSDGGTKNTTTTTTIANSPAVLRLHSSEVLSAILQHEDYTTNTRGPRLTALPKYTLAFDDNEEDTDGKKKSVTDLSDVATIDGMEVLLLAIATYHKSDPTMEVQCEFLENAFDILSASLLREDNVTDFVEAEGIELMLRCVRQKVYAGVGHYGCLTLHCRDHPPPLP
jgi:beta-catenin-like protein 1